MFPLIGLPDVGEGKGGFLFPLPDQIFCPVRGPVINDQDLKVTAGLPCNALKCPRERAGPVVGRNKDSKFGFQYLSPQARCGINVGFCRSRAVTHRTNGVHVAPTINLSVASCNNPLEKRRDSYHPVPGNRAKPPERNGENDNKPITEEESVRSGTDDTNSSVDRTPRLRSIKSK